MIAAHAPLLQVIWVTQVTLQGLLLESRLLDRKWRTGSLKKGNANFEANLSSTQQADQKPAACGCCFTTTPTSTLQTNCMSPMHSDKFDARPRQSPQNSLSNTKTIISNACPVCGATAAPGCNHTGARMQCKLAHVTCIRQRFKVNRGSNAIAAKSCTNRLAAACSTPGNAACIAASSCWLHTQGAQTTAASCCAGAGAAGLLLVRLCRIPYAHIQALADASATGELATCPA